MKVALCRDINWLLSEEAFSIYSPCMYQPTLKKYREQMGRFINSDPSVKVFVCESNCRKAGILVLDGSGVVPEIIGIAVAEGQRHQGIGKQMIQAVMESEQIKTIKAQTDDGAIGFYRSCGFTEERVIKEYPDGISVRYNCSLDR